MITIDQNHLLMVQHGKISTGRAKELIEAELQKELEELAKEAIGEITFKEIHGYGSGWNDHRQEVISAFERRGIKLSI